MGMVGCLLWMARVIIFPTHSGGFLAPYIFVLPKLALFCSSCTLSHKTMRTAHTFVETSWKLTRASGRQSLYWLRLHDFPACSHLGNVLYRDAGAERRQGQLHVCNYACPDDALRHARHQPSLSRRCDEPPTTASWTLRGTSVRFLDQDLARLRRWEKPDPHSCCAFPTRPVRRVFYSGEVWRPCSSFWTQAGR